jgi:hypothetical protein
LVLAVFPRRFATGAGDAAGQARQDSLA